MPSENALGAIRLVELMNEDFCEFQIGRTLLLRAFGDACQLFDDIDGFAPSRLCNQQICQEVQGFVVDGILFDDAHQAQACCRGIVKLFRE